MAISYPGSRALISEALKLNSVPEVSLDICTDSLAPATLKQYNVGLRLWWSFCQSRNINVFLVTVPLLLEFLTIHYQKGLSYGSLNSYRSAIAQIARFDIAEDFRVKRFFKGVYGHRPSLPRYSSTWDLALVLNFIRTLSPIDMSLDILSQKLVVLLALATGQRAQTLTAIDNKE